MHCIRRISVGALFLSFTLIANAEPAIGDLRSKVDAELGQPSVVATIEPGLEIGRYSRGTVTFKDGRSIKILLIDAAELKALEQADAELIKDVIAAKNRFGDAKELGRLSQSPYAMVRGAVAGNYGCPSDVLEKLKHDAENAVAQRAITTMRVVQEMKSRPGGPTQPSSNAQAQNPITSPDTLEKLAGNDDVVVRRYVAMNWNTSPETLERLSRDTDLDVRKNVLMNRRTPPSVMEKLATDSNWVIRNFVAANPRTPLSALELLAEDSEQGVRINVIENSRATASLLEKLSKDANPTVRRFVASSFKTPDVVLEKLVMDSDWSVRANLAGNPNTPPSVLEKLATDRVDGVRSALPLNPSTPDSVLKQLTKDTVSSIQERAMGALRRRPKGANPTPAK